MRDKSSGNKEALMYHLRRATRDIGLALDVESRNSSSYRDLRGIMSALDELSRNIRRDERRSVAAQAEQSWQDRKKSRGNNE